MSSPHKPLPEDLVAALLCLREWIATTPPLSPICGGAPEQPSHVHTRDCYDDAGPGRGGVSLICGGFEEPDDFPKPMSPSERTEAARRLVREWEAR